MPDDKKNDDHIEPFDKDDWTEMEERRADSLRASEARMLRALGKLKAELKKYISETLKSNREVLRAEMKTVVSEQTDKCSGTFARADSLPRTVEQELKRVASEELDRSIAKGTRIINAIRIAAWALAAVGILVLVLLRTGLLSSKGGVESLIAPPTQAEELFRGFGR